MSIFSTQRFEISNLPREKNEISNVLQYKETCVPSKKEIWTRKNESMPIKIKKKGKWNLTMLKPMLSSTMVNSIIFEFKKGI